MLIITNLGTQNIAMLLENILFCPQPRRKKIECFVALLSLCEKYTLIINIQNNV